MKMPQMPFGNPVERLSKRSEDILSVFTKTINDLREINASVSEEVSSREIQKAKLDEELLSLNQVKVRNESVISKVTKFLEP